MDLRPELANKQQGSLNYMLLKKGLFLPESEAESQEKELGHLGVGGGATSGNVREGSGL